MWLLYNLCINLLGEIFLMSTDSDKPPRIKAQIKSAPKIKQLYWCDFPNDAHLPEFWKRRPVIIISYKRHTLTGAATIVPCSTQDQTGNPWAFELNTSMTGEQSWAICDKISTVAVSRLTADRSGIPQLQDQEFNKMLELVLNWLPKLRP